jgi:signal peptidase II
MKIEITKKSILTALLLIAIIALNLAADRITKDHAVKNIKGSIPRREVLASFNLSEEREVEFFALEFAENKGSFLGLGKDWPQAVKIPILVIIPALLLLVLTFYILTSAKPNLTSKIAYSFIIAGGLGNIWDRAFNGGKVVDFMQMDLILFPTGIFNVADMSVLTGAAILIVYFIVDDIKNRKKRKKLKAEREKAKAGN